MRTFSVSLLTLAVGIGIGVTIAGRQARVEVAPVRSRQELAAGHQHTTRQREMDIRRRGKRFRRKPEPYLHAVSR